MFILVVPIKVSPLKAGQTVLKDGSDGKVYVTWLFSFLQSELVTIRLEIITSK